MWGGGGLDNLLQCLDAHLVFFGAADRDADAVADGVVEWAYEHAAFHERIEDLHHFVFVLPDGHHKVGVGGDVADAEPVEFLVEVLELLGVVVDRFFEEGGIL